MDPTPTDRGLFAATPCRCVARHNPLPVEVELHHLIPQWMQQRVWGRVRDQTLIPVCPTTHMNIHALINATLHGVPPPHASAYTRAQAAPALAFARAHNLPPPYPPLIVPAEG